MTDPESTHFINVDLDIRTGFGLRRLVRALKPATVLLNVSEQEATLELAEQPATMEEAIEGLAKAIQRLPPEVRSVWDSCEKRTMDVGVAAGSEPNQALFHLPLATILLLVNTGQTSSSRSMVRTEGR